MVGINTGEQREQRGRAQSSRWTSGKDRRVEKTYTDCDAELWVVVEKTAELAGKREDGRMKTTYVYTSV